MNKQDFVNYILKRYDNYTCFIKNKIYQLARKRNYLSSIKYCFDNNVLYREELD